MDTNVCVVGHILCSKQSCSLLNRACLCLVGIRRPFTLPAAGLGAGESMSALSLGIRLDSSGVTATIQLKFCSVLFSGRDHKGKKVLLDLFGGISEVNKGGHKGLKHTVLQSRLVTQPLITLCKVMGALPWFYQSRTDVPGKNHIWRRHLPVTEPKYNFTWGCCSELWRTRHLGTAGSQAQLLRSLALQKPVCKTGRSPLDHPLMVSGAYSLPLSFHLVCRPWRPVWSVLMVDWGIPWNSGWVWWLLFADFKKFLASSSFSWLSSLHSKPGRILDLTWQWEELALTFNWKGSPWPRFYACVETLAAKIIFQCLPVCPVTFLCLQISPFSMWIGQCDLLGKHLLKFRANQVLWGAIKCLRGKACIKHEHRVVNNSAPLHLF